ncbi:type III-B CRISPR module RAMP protein Cmr4 [Pyrofollis japonicus]|uniref:type III-B CRISPR module RAMP protein Cmr4 n=1 Tax=Pyrofollis japonicus TaxID=3060460 RepID=UPI00295AE074|nr:type III-B CRISPR module RAMP protein Cmr4 [Pyrofollis japonicus]
MGQGALAGIYEKGDLVLLSPVSGLFVGSGRDTSCSVDLAVQRDFAGYPIIWGSSLKGALRSAFTLRCEGAGEGCRDCVRVLFGNEREDIEAFAGSMYVSDFGLLALAGPCSFGVCFFTSPFILQRFMSVANVLVSGLVEISNGLRNVLSAFLRDASELLESNEDALNAGRPVVSVSSLQDMKYLVFGTKIYSSDHVVLESMLGDVFRRVFRYVFGEDAARVYSERVVLVPDNVAARLLGQSLIPRRTRVSLDYRSKRVRPGALWSEEYVPELSLFYGIFLYSRPREPMRASSCRKFLKEDSASVEDAEFVRSVFRKLAGAGADSSFYTIIGGHETVGRGLVHIKLVEG